MSFERKRKSRNIHLEKAKEIVSKVERKQICLWVDSISHRKLKARAALEGVSITDVINKSIDLYIKSK